MKIKDIKLSSSLGVIVNDLLNKVLVKDKTEQFVGLIWLSVNFLIHYIKFFHQVKCFKVESSGKLNTLTVKIVKTSATDGESYYNRFQKVSNALSWMPQPDQKNKEYSVIRFRFHCLHVFTTTHSPP